MAYATVVVATVFLFDGELAAQTTLTHSIDPAIVEGNSISCNDGLGVHSNNSYLRNFVLADFGVTQDYQVDRVDIGIEFAEMLDDSGDDIPATINFYTGDISGFSGLELLYSMDVVVPHGTNLELLTFPGGPSIPGGVNNLVVEFFTPGADGKQAMASALFIGSNPFGETAPSYIAAAICSFPDPVPTADIGYPDMHIVMNVHERLPGSCVVGDVNQDGAIDLLDVSPFVDLLVSGIYQCEADVDENGAIDLLDVAPFVKLLSVG